MKIAIVTFRFPPQGETGGIEIASQDMARSFASMGNSVCVITSGIKTDIENIQKNLSVYRIINPNIKFLSSVIFWFKVFFILKKVNPDIVHCQTIQMGLPCFVYKRVFKKPYIVWCHGFDVYFKWKFKKIISRIVFSFSDAVVAITEHMKKELQKTYKKEIFVIPNSVNLEKFKGHEKQELRKRYNILGSEKIVLFVGVVRPVKGVKYLVSAFKIINQKIPESKLYIIGEGSEIENLKNLAIEKNIEDKVIFKGKIDTQKVAEYMILSDIFVLPSLSEGFPLVLLEAMAAGLPIVCTNVRGLPEIVEDNKNGLLIDPKNSDQISEKVLLILGSKELQDKMHINNLEKSKLYSLENIIEKVNNLYLKVLSYEK